MQNMNEKGKIETHKSMIQKYSSLQNRKTKLKNAQHYKFTMLIIKVANMV